MKRTYKKKSWLIGLVALAMLSGCKKLLQIDQPVNKITGAAVYNEVSTSVAVLNGIYAHIYNNTLGNRLFEGGLTSDEIFPADLGYTQFADPYRNIYQGYLSPYSSYWASFYQNEIYGANSVIEGVAASTGLTVAQKKVLTGEAKFIRAFCYFYLVNFFGDAPLVLSTDLKTNEKIARSSTESVYLQMIGDLTEAESDLSPNFLDKDILTVTAERVRPDKFAAAALLARVYLYHNDWTKSEIEAGKVIDNKADFEILPDLNQVFLKNSRETIWALQPDNPSGGGLNTNTIEGKIFINNSSTTGNSPALRISDSLYQAFDFNDKRRSSWIGVYTDNSVTPAINLYFPYKYKVGTNYTSDTQEQQEYSIVLRLAEQYLIRSEARAQQNKLTGAGSAQEDLNVIRARAGLAPTTATGKTELLAAILKERRKELFTEYWNRWFDLKRTGNVDKVMGAVEQGKGGTWASYKALFPIPVSEFSANPALRGHQNPGYPENL